jgi:hypothetical protein
MCSIRSKIATIRPSARHQQSQLVVSPPPVCVSFPHISLITKSVWRSCPLPMQLTDYHVVSNFRSLSHSLVHWSYLSEMLAVGSVIDLSQWECHCRSAAHHFHLTELHSTQSSKQVRPTNVSSTSMTLPKWSALPFYFFHPYVSLALLSFINPFLACSASSLPRALPTHLAPGSLR